MGSHSVTCSATRHKWTRRYSIYLPRRDGRLSWPRYLESGPTGNRTHDRFDRKSDALTVTPPRHPASASRQQASSLWQQLLYQTLIYVHTDSEHCRSTQNFWVAKVLECCNRPHHHGNLIIISLILRFVPHLKHENKFCYYYYYYYYSNRTDRTNSLVPSMRHSELAAKTHYQQDPRTHRGSVETPSLECIHSPRRYAAETSSHSLFLPAIFYSAILR